MISQEIILIVAISILYSYFFKKLADVLTKSEEIEKECDGYYGSYYFCRGDDCDDPEKKAQQERCRQLRAQVDTKKFFILLAAGVLGVMIATQVKIPAASVGVGVGGVLSVLYATYVYWSNFNEMMKLGAIGVSLVALLYTSVRLFQEQSLFKVFSKLL